MKQATPETLTLKVFGRTGLGKNEAFRLRQKEMIPAVVYGPKLKTPVPVSISPRDVKAVYGKAGKTTLVTLEAVEGAPNEINGTKVFFKEIQSHPLRNTLTHVDLHQLDLSRKIRVIVPLTFVGKAKGLAEGGIMSISARQVEVKGLPQEIPSHIDVDVSDLGVNDSVHIEELSKKYESAKFEFIFEANVALVAIVPPEEEKAAAPIAGADAAAGAAPAAGAPGAPAAAGAAPAAGAKGAAPAAGGGGAKAPAAGAAKAPAAKK